MTTKATVDEFLAQQKLAVVGVSRSASKFGRSVYKDLKAKGYQVYAVNPNAAEIEGDPSYPSLSALPEKVDGVVLVVPPVQSEKVVQEAAQLGIARVWMQSGAESAQAIAFCQQHGMQVVSGQCIMMFASDKKFPHNVHRFINKVTGKLPK